MQLQEQLLNVAGGEWFIIIIVALALILGTGKMPEIAKKLGRAINEFNSAKDGIREHVNEAALGGVQKTPEISGPVQTERKKLETIAESIGIKSAGKTDEQLRNSIAKSLNRSGMDDDRGHGADNGSSDNDGRNDNVHSDGDGNDTKNDSNHGHDQKA